MTCPNCGSINETGKFCTKCGSKIEQPVQNHSQERMEENVTIESTTQPKIETTNEYVEKGKVVTKQYVNHFVKALKNPTYYGKDVNSSQMVNGLITMVLLSLFFALTVYFGVSNFYQAFSGSLFDEQFLGDIFSGADQGFRNEISFSEFFVKPFFYMILFLAVITGSIYGVLNISSVKATFQDVLARSGTFFIIPALVLFVTFIFSLLDAGYDILNILSMFAYISLYLAIGYTMYSFKNSEGQKLDPLFGTLVVLAVVIILSAIIGDNFVSNLFLPAGF